MKLIVNLALIAVAVFCGATNGAPISPSNHPIPESSAQHEVESHRIEKKHVFAIPEGIFVRPEEYVKHAGVNGNKAFEHFETEPIFYHNDKEMAGEGIMENMDEMFKNYEEMPEVEHSLYYDENASHDKYRGEEADDDGEDMERANSFGLGLFGGYPGSYIGQTVVPVPYVAKPCHFLFGCKFTKWFG